MKKRIIAPPRVQAHKYNPRSRPGAGQQSGPASRQADRVPSRPVHIDVLVLLQRKMVQNCRREMTMDGTKDVVEIGPVKIRKMARANRRPQMVGKKRWKKTQE
jgi:hypothetical protein